MKLSPDGITEREAILKADFCYTATRDSLTGETQYFIVKDRYNANPSRDLNETELIIRMLQTDLKLLKRFQEYLKEHEPEYIV